MTNNNIKLLKNCLIEKYLSKNNVRDPRFENHSRTFTAMSARWQVGGSGFRRRPGGPRFSRFHRVVFVVVPVVILIFVAIGFSFNHF